ncbi:MAG: alpha-galactosidase [Pseudomonadota bacterium]
MRIDGKGVTLVLAQRENQLPEPIHFGAPLPPGEDLLALSSMARRSLSGGALDTLAPLSLLPEEGRSTTGRPGLCVCAPDGGGWLTAFHVTTIDQTPQSITIAAEDAGLALRLELSFEGAVLTARTHLTNKSDTPRLLSQLSAPALPIFEHARRLVTFTGRWIGEFHEVARPIEPGEIVVEARTGRTSHEHPPYALAEMAGTTANLGEVLAFHLGWSGGHTMACEELADGRRQIQFGALYRPGEIILEPGDSITTPTLHAAYSNCGRSGIAQAFHAHVRSFIGHQARPRPVTYNSWEAVYFNHDLASLKGLAEQAASLGAERFVLDDGWFGTRDDDTTSLGDWTVDPRKWPDGLGPLIDVVLGLNMEFGLWIEPEMVSPDSVFLREHPHWLLADPDRPPLLGRNQLVLDLGRADVRDALFDTIDKLLSSHPIGYVKWDHNRVLSAPSGGDGRAGVVRHTEGFYALLDRLVAAHPNVEFESCASGGGRIDYGVLQRAGRVWLSDSNDAVERMRMQHTAALFVPPEVIGSHVGPRNSHTSGRVLSMAARAATAASRHMGFECNLSELTEAERKTLARIVSIHKAIRPILFGGTIHFLEPEEPQAYGELYTLADRFVAFVSFAQAPARASTRPLRLEGLEPQTRYRVRLINQEAVDERDLRSGPSPLMDERGVVQFGETLQRVGLHLPIHRPATVWILEGERVS